VKIITLVVLFSVLSTTPDHYNVLSPEGSINAKNCIDLIIRLTSQVPATSLVPLESKFRVQVVNYATKQPLGRKDVPSTIIFGQAHPLLDSLDPDTFQNILGDSASAASSAMSSRRNIRSDPPPAFQDYSYAQPNNINYVAIITGIVCIIGLLLPLDSKEEPSAVIPSYLHLTVNQKLIVSFL